MNCHLDRKENVDHRANLKPAQREVKEMTVQMVLQEIRVPSDHRVVEVQLALVDLREETELMDHRVHRALKATSVRQEKKVPRVLQVVKAPTGRTVKKE